MKKVLSLGLALLLLIGILGCGERTPLEDPPTIDGVEDVTVYLDESFDVMEGITAADALGRDLTDAIEVTGVVDTSSVGTYFLRYSVEDRDGNRTERTRNVTVEVDPELVGDDMVRNGDFSLGMAFWSYTTGLEGGTASFEVVDEELKIDIHSVSGGMWEPRLENQGITFEEGVSYKLSFDARAEDPRAIHIQIGELLPAAPWFNNFKPAQVDIVDLTTEMETYEVIFTMTQETNENGSVLFEMGTVGEENHITTVYLDNVIITETEPVYSEPVISGANDISIETGSVFDPLEGVTVFDAVEGELELTLEHIEGEVDVNTPGEYVLTYTISNSEGLTAVVTRTITVVDLIFNPTDIVRNGNFETPLDEEDPEWTLWQADWDPEGSPMTDGSLFIENDQMVLEVNDIGTWGYQGWLLQASQNIELQKGYTYKVIFEAKAEEAREITSVVGFLATGDVWNQYGGGNFNLTTELQTFEYIFTVTQESGEYLEELKFEFGHADATIMIEYVEIQILDEEPLQVNGSFDEIGWHMWSQYWGAAPVVDYSIVDEELVVVIEESLGDANWAIQLLQEQIAMNPEATYRVSFDARSDHERDINFKFIEGAEGGLEFAETFTITETMETYTFDFVFDSSLDFGRVSIELGAMGDAVPGEIIFDNISMVELDEEEDVIEGSERITNGTFDQIVGWHHWSQDWDNIPVVSKEVVDGELVFTIDETLGDEPWSIQLFQALDGLTPNATYVFEFEMRASEPRDINAKMIVQPGTLEWVELVSLTEEMQHFVFIVEFDFDSTEAVLNFEFGNFDDAEVGEIVVDNVKVYRTFNE